jgi:molecular chaperone DnaJ
MDKKDYYDILGVGRDADATDIKRAYRRLVTKYHPDRNPDDPEAAKRMKELNEAYAVLSGSQKRQLYDLYGHEGLNGYAREDIFQGVDFSGLFREFGVRDLFDLSGPIFGDLFGPGKAGQRRRRKGVALKRLSAYRKQSRALSAKARVPSLAG